MSMAMKNALNKTVERFINSSVTSANTFIFVYGTLKRNEPNYEIMTNISTGKCHLIGCGRTVERFPLLIASKFNIPFCLQQPGIGYRIHGEVYEVDEAKMNALDEFEAHPHFYKRQLQQIEMDSGELLMAWIYLLSSWKPELVQEGSEFMENYSSKGSHGRPYVSRHIREKQIDIDGEGLIEQITGHLSK